MQKDDENGSDDEAPSGYERGFSPINSEQRNIRTLNVADLLDRMVELRQRSLKAENGLNGSMTRRNLNFASGGVDYISLISANSVRSTSSMSSTSSMPTTSSTTVASSLPSTSRMESAIDLSSTRMQSSSMSSASGMPSTSGVIFTRRMPSTSDQPSASGHLSASSQPSASGQPSASSQPSASGQPSASSQPSASGQSSASDCSNWSTAASPCNSGSSSPMFLRRNSFGEDEEAGSSPEPFNVNKVPSGCVQEPPKHRSYGVLNIDPPVRSFGGGASNYPVPPMPSPESCYRPLTSRNGCPLLYDPSEENPKSQLHPFGLGGTDSTSVSGTLRQSEVIGEPTSSDDKKETGGSDDTEKSKKSDNQGEGEQSEKRETSDSNKPTKGKARPGQKTKNRKKCNESQSQ